MELTLAGIFVVGIVAFALRRDIANGVVLAIGFLPFGALAVVNLPAVGGISLLAAHTTAALSLATAGALFLVSRQRQTVAPLPLSALLLVSFAAYGVFASLLYPRLFHHAFLVFSLAREPQNAIYLGGPIRSPLVPLEPNASNFSQSAYLVLGVLFFLLARAIASERGPRVLHRAIELACVVNIGLGVLDLFALDPLLAYIRTANYVIHAQHQTLGFQRIIGGFAEASIFGGFSTAMCAYFTSLYLDRRTPRIGLLAAASGAFSILAFASTAYASIAVVGTLLLGRSLLDTLRFGVRERTLPWAVLVGATVSVVALVLLVATPIGAFVGELLDELIFKKAGSESGIERGLWAEYGYRAFFATYGLGAGIGSLRSNGLIAVLLSNVGIPGTLLFCGFLWFVYLRPTPRPARGSMEWAWLRAASACAASILAAQLVSGTTPDPGLFFVSLSALAVTCRETAPRASRAPTAATVADRALDGSPLS
ncbi:MAG: hypothetical protein H6923_10130 [Alphaproteobacteria bacterium]|nr:hypothetical protein [Alphaproteobacteria bacterium]